MGVLNMTPDSFSDGGSYSTYGQALRKAKLMVAQGASIIDVGGESTRPNAMPVALTEELERVIPVVEACVSQGLLVSVDTMKPEVMSAAVSAGAIMLNDVNGFRAPGVMTVVKTLVSKQMMPYLCVMHMQGTPSTMQINPEYKQLFPQMQSFFSERIQALATCGILNDHILLDPGFGFGKTDEHNWSLLANLDVLLAHNCRLLVGLSRKSMFGRLLNRDVSERLPASLAGALLAVQKGAKIIRVHDVKETADVLRVHAAYQKAVTLKAFNQ